MLVIKVNMRKKYLKKKQMKNIKILKHNRKVKL